MKKTDDRLIRFLLTILTKNVFTNIKLNDIISVSAGMANCKVVRAKDFISPSATSHS